ncbi:MAG: translocation/assembly module TamB domain-containing protein [Deltaproteobacteria bacterium]|nr:translocation/assembly module TamB domain-containing protein [Deltaproteobacteria bacterium]
MRHEREQRARLLVRSWLLILSALFVLAIAGLFRWANVPATQHAVLRWISAHTTWTITIDAMEWRPLQSHIRFENINIRHRTNEHAVHADHLEMRYSPWAALRGALRMRTLRITGLVARIERAASPAEPQRSLKLRHILLLRNVTVEDGLIDGVAVQLPGQQTLTAHRLSLHFQPKILQDVRLNIDVSQPQLMRNGKTMATMEHLTLLGATNVRRWIATAPFINDLRGSLSIAGGDWQRLQIDTVTAIAQFRGRRLTLKNLMATIQGKSFQGNGHVEMGTGASAIHLAWPDPLPVPELLRETSFFTTAGTVQGTIDWQGTLGTPEKITGELAVDITHTPDASVAGTSLPAHLTADGTWKEGRYTLARGTLAVADGAVTVSGSIDLPQRSIDIVFSGSDIPIAGVLGRFRREDFHPVEGIADCHGHFAGWQRDFTFDLEANHVRNGTYQGIAVEDLRFQMHLTYPQLTLHGELLQDGHSTGQLDMTTHYGARQESGWRTSTIALDAVINNHRLDPAFPLIGLRGMGSGEFHLRGASNQYAGTASVTLKEGALDAIPFEQITSTFDLRPKVLTFHATEIKIPNVPPIQWEAPLAMTLDRGFHLQGSPLSALSLDFAYASGSRQWTVHRIAYQAPGERSPLLIRGSGRSGAWDLTVGGMAESQWLEFLPGVIREAQGPLAVDLRIRGALNRPQLFGTVHLEQNALILRDDDHEWSALRGTLIFHGSRISLDQVTGLMGDGPFHLTGWVEQAGPSLPNMALELQGKSLQLAFDDGFFRVEFDADVEIARAGGGKTTLRGDIHLIEGLYTKEFRLLEHVARREAAVKREIFRKARAGYDQFLLDLAVTSRGELLINNNVAEVALRPTITIGGHLANPQIRGAIEATEGILHYLGIEFEVVNGSMEFHPPFFDPFIRFTGEQVIGTHLVQVTLRGPVNNLRVDLSAVPGEDRKNVLCLIAYGSTCDQLRISQFGSKLGPGIFLEQVGRVLERPISKITGLDVVRVESVTSSANFSQLYLGKQISDRLEVNFVTSVGESTSEQSVEAAYQITDFLLLKGRQSTRNRTQFNVSLRFRER